MINDKATTTQQPPESNEQLLQELKALSTMLNQGFSFGIKKKSFLKWFSKKKERTIFIYKLTLGTMDRLAEVQLKMNINQARLIDNPLAEKNKAIKENAKLLARAVSISVLNSAWKTRLFGRLFAWYVLEHIDAEKAWEITQIIDVIQDAGNFINSIGLLSGMTRTSQPKPDQIEAAPLG